MANHKQALKRHRQSLKRQARNNYAKATMRTFLKKARTTLADADADATEAVKSAVSYLDHIAGKGIIPKERASRLKSRLESKLNKV
ncbi:MAG: 30S ribosomal protein S20 [Deltaproteobacteria bacterium HGW-Deltaproteobacteria-14]|jgi:small subunit ribosomal protein S20|nr:MAG: 30S ribosomal protein S20 [Deltaproteobacteria bacterium HGW-Deltaproteobacteria-14]